MANHDMGFLLLIMVVEANAIAMRHVNKEDMRHIAKAIGATHVRKTKRFNLLGLIFPFFH